MEKSLLIRPFVQDAKKFTVYCAVCSEKATVELVNPVEDVGVVAVERFCDEHAPLYW
jgi:hypothetical protein